MPNEDDIKRVPISGLRQEEGAHELATSKDMEPYIEFAKAVMTNADKTVELEAIRQLPLERRYVWRVASAMKWAFADFDNLSVDADRMTLTTEDATRLVELLRLRPVQFCMFFRALLGAEAMENLITNAVRVAKDTE
jgi:hypothetical protein